MVKVAIVNDDTDLLEICEIVLSRSGYEIVYTARNGYLAVLKNRNRPAQIILMNYWMPIMDGIEATKEILAKFPKTKIIIESGSSVEERAMAVGATRFISSSFKFMDLCKIVDEVAQELE